MVFIYTCSQDGTTDLVTTSLGAISVFRLNVDKLDDYSWDFFNQGFKISNKITKTSICSDTLTSFYLRKPILAQPIDIPKEGSLESWCNEEVEELFYDLYRDCEFRHLTTLVHSKNSHYGKLRQMRTAQNFFKVAPWHMFHGALPAELNRGTWVAKALSGASIGRCKMFLVKEVDPLKLDLSYPWFLQEKIDGEDEVTVVYVNGRLFGYRYPRSAIKDCADVRKATFEAPSCWEPCELTPSERSAICGFMNETGYRFGRFDFIRKDGELWFLELNPNGQWAWLDSKNENGLISAIAEEIIFEERCHQRMLAPRH